MTLEGYLKYCAENGVIDHALRYQIDTDGATQAFVHPDGKDGPTLILDVLENRLRTIYSSDAKAES